MSTEPTPLCPACNTGHLQEKRIDYTVPIEDGLKVVIPNLLVEVCDHCGEMVLSADAADAVDAAIAEKTEQLGPGELERIREELQVDQTEMSDILGLGAKTYHRWERGNQVPSRSMGYYLRVLAQFPKAFAWLKARGWRPENRLAAKAAQIDLENAFPNLYAYRTETTVVVQRNITMERSVASNPARALFRKAK
ncbi:MAG: type II toxin-antitoxin system MqsA family antitoxin [Chthoniobacter sp.]|nr:type II toxin-antitoxin system MqsA family antitoxin [Chthoniobacter sp.]